MCWGALAPCPCDFEGRPAEPLVLLLLPPALLRPAGLGTSAHGTRWPKAILNGTPVTDADRPRGAGRSTGVAVKEPDDLVGRNGGENGGNGDPLADAAA